MPIYDYQCQCGHEFEAGNTIGNRLNMTCPECSSREVKLLITTSKKDWFRPHWNEHFTHEKEIFVESKEHYKKLCKEYGVYAKCLL